MTKRRSITKHPVIYDKNQFTVTAHDMMWREYIQVLQRENRVDQPWLFGQLPLRYSQGDVVENPTPYLLEAEPHITGDINSAVELGCGLGRNSLYLYRRGFNVNTRDQSQNVADFVSGWAGTYKKTFGLEKPFLTDVKRYDGFNPDVLSGKPKLVLLTNSLTGLAQIGRGEIEDECERVAAIDMRARELLSKWTQASSSGDLWIVAGFNDADNHPLQEWDNTQMFTPSSDTGLKPARCDIRDFFPESEWEVLKAEPNRTDVWESKTESMRNRSFVLARKK